MASDNYKRNMIIAMDGSEHSDYALDSLGLGHDDDDDDDDDGDPHPCNQRTFYHVPAITIINNRLLSSQSDLSTRSDLTSIPPVQDSQTSSMIYNS
ncbi:hypothetical protein PoB_004827300 [Plakobranchus ocellatus]|uniref:Uncharacterized protein n=1 Tax=Plakobranchus ocellatus TaxID=259542 RepID=A0AAV4BRK9_9GAST|nr:hypothetical protein PoB_004827300 [Plakobranchus ocellatus]